MKKPEKAPPVAESLLELGRSRRLGEILEAVGSHPSSRKYFHWDKLRFRKPPTGLTHREWWGAIQLQREAQFAPLPLSSVDGYPFRYACPDPIPEWLHRIDMGLGGRIGMPDEITNPESRDEYVVASLIEEAITSSQLEGATTTRPRAKEMIRARRAPRDRSERMILNNYLTMERIGKLRRERFSPELVFEIQRIVTTGTLDEPSAAGRFRKSNEYKVVGDPFGRVTFHEPPPAEELAERMEAMCAFANGETPGEFVHPVVRSIILHFWLAYDHPFVDGNGRTARALFYWSMLHREYWLCEFISISEIIRKAPAKYGRAFLLTETDGNDLTYFLLYHVEVIRRAIDQLHEYINRRTKELQSLERELRGIVVLNYRQRALVGHALRHSQNRYTIESHRGSHNVVYQTARTDLLNLVERDLFDVKKQGKTMYFRPVEDLSERLKVLT